MSTLLGMRKICLVEAHIMMPFLKKSWNIDIVSALMMFQGSLDSFTSLV